METSWRCANGLRRLVRRVLAIQTVHKALQLGRLVNAEVELFNEGLVNMGNFWNVTISTSATNEMISTGLLREMDNPDLRAAIGKVPDEFQRLSDFTAIFRLENGVLIDELAGIVTYTYTGEYLPADQIDKFNTDFERNVEVSYDFESLSSNQRLMNLVLEAVDSHRDTWAINRSICSLFREIESQLAVPESIGN